MIRRYGTREETIQQAHVYDVEAMTDEERAFCGRPVGTQLKSCKTCQRPSQIQFRARIELADPSERFGGNLGGELHSSGVRFMMHP